MADFDGGAYISDQPEDHDNPSVSRANTSSYDASAYNAIPIEKYATTRAGNARFRCSVLPAALTTSSMTTAGNTRVNKPTDTKSDNRRSETGFTTLYAPCLQRNTNALN